MKALLKNLARRAGYRISPIPVWFEDPWADMQKLVPARSPTIFDVGGNVGQTVERFRIIFPNSQIHSFEPSPETFEKLKAKTSGSGVHPWNFAMGARGCHLDLQENSDSTMSSFFLINEAAWGSVRTKTTVVVRTVDDFCAEQGISRIDILKSDTQGYDLDVLRGAERMISEGRVGFVFCELIMSRMYKGMPSFGAVCDFLWRHDFLLVSFYQAHYRSGLAGWMDALFSYKPQHSPSIAPTAC